MAHTRFAIATPPSSTEKRKGFKKWRTETEIDSLLLFQYRRWGLGANYSNLIQVVIQERPIPILSPLGFHLSNYVRDLLKNFF